MKILIKFIYIIIILNTSISLSAQLDTLYIEDFTDQEYPEWEVSDPATQRQAPSNSNNNGIIFEDGGGNSIHTLISPILKLGLYDSLILVTNDLFEVTDADNLTLSISEDGGDTYNIHFDLETIESDTVNLSDTLSSFNNIKFKHTIEFNGFSSATKYWEITECQVLGKIFGGNAKVATKDDDDDRKRFHFECLPVHENINLNVILINERPIPLSIEDLFIDVDIIPNSISFDLNKISIKILTDSGVLFEDYDTFTEITLEQNYSAIYNIPILITGSPSNQNVDQLNFYFGSSKFTDSDFEDLPANSIHGYLPTKIGNCCQDTLLIIDDHTNQLPYFYGTTSNITINDINPLGITEKSILVATDYILLEPSNIEKYISISFRDQFKPDPTGIFMASIEECTPPTDEPEIGKVAGKAKFDNLKILIFPNPTTETLNFNINTEIEGKFINIEIINTFGNILLQKKICNINSDFFEINTSLLPNGLYYAKIYNSKFVETKKFYKQ